MAKRTKATKRAGEPSLRRSDSGRAGETAAPQKRRRWPASLTDRQIAFLGKLQEGLNYPEAWREAMPERKGRPDHECRRGAQCEITRLLDDPAHQQLLEQVVRRGTNATRIKMQITLNANLDHPDPEVRQKFIELNLERFEDVATGNPFLDDEPIIGPEHGRE